MSWKVTFINSEAEQEALVFPAHTKGGVGDGSATYEGVEVMARVKLKSFKAKALARPDVAEEYQRLTPAYQLRRKLVALRQEAGLTQEQLAKRLNTSKSNISRLESVNSTISPKLSTIEDYAAAMGYTLEIDFIPKQA